MKTMFICAICSSEFYSAHPGRKPRYCTSKCYGESKKGTPTWNKGTKGIMKPNNTSYKPGNEHRYWKGINAHYKVVPISQRTDTSLLHRHIMAQKLCKPIPKDYHVHHIDHNKHNNHPDNLMLIHKTMHATYHANVMWGNIKRHSKPWILQPN